MAELTPEQISQQQFSPAVTALQTLFGRSQRQMAIIKGQQAGQEKYAQGDALENRLSKIFIGYADLQYDKLSRYRDYDRMDVQSTECQTALDIYAEEASQRDAKTALRVWIESKDETLATELNGMLQRMRMESKAYGIYRSIAKYGDCYLYLLLGGYGVHDTQYIHPSRLERVQEDGLLAYKAPELTGVVPVDNKNGLFKPWDFLHFRIMAYDQEAVYGRSMLEALRKTWKQLSMMETMLVLFRVSKAVQRNIFYVDVGQASVQDTQVLVKEYDKFLKNKKNYIDPKTNEFRPDFDPSTFLQDIIWPIRSNSQSKVEQLQNSSNIGPLEDMEHFNRKIIIGLGIPKDYFTGELTGGWNSKESLILQDTRFSRKIQKLQDSMREGVIKLCQIHWAIAHQMYLPPDSFQVQLGTISDVAERGREDVLLRKAQILELLGNLSVTMGWNRWVWGDYLLDEIYPLPSKLRNLLKTPDPVDEIAFERQEDMAKIGGGKGGGKPGGKPGGAKKPDKKVTADNLKTGFRNFGYGGEQKPNIPTSTKEETDELIGSQINELEEAINALREVEGQLKEIDGQAIIARSYGFDEEFITAFIAKRPTMEYRMISPATRNKINWKQLNEMGIAPGAISEKGFEVTDESHASSLNG